MLAIFDTNILIALDKGDQQAVSKIRELGNEFQSLEAAVTWVNFFEFYYGAKGEALATKSLDFLNKFTFLGMDRESTKIFTKLRRAGSNVKDFDLLIASIALANNAILFTRDGDFKHVPELKYKLIE